MTHRRHKDCWSELHPELLTLIAGRFQTRHDFLHFRSVCTNWRSSTHQIPNNLPILSPIVPHKFVRTLPTLPCEYGNSLTIVANTTFLIQNPNSNFPKPWLLTVEELNPGKLIPLLRNTIKEKIGSFLDLSRFRVRKIRQDYNFKRGGRGGREFLPVNYKVLLLSDNVCGHPSSDCYVLVLDHYRHLLFTRFKKEYEYSYLKYSSTKFFDDIVCYKGAVWTVDKGGKVYVIRYDSKHLRLRRFAANGVCIGYARHSRKRLIETDDGLYLICKDDGPSAEGKFSVYKLNEWEKKWCKVKDLDGRILFVSSDCCFFASVEDFPGYAGNCILFPKDHFGSWIYYRDDQYFEGADKVLEIEVFHMEDGENGLITTYPGLSDIFWPPPCWLFSHTCPSTSLLGDEEQSEGKIQTLDALCASNGVQISEQVLKTKSPVMDSHPKHRDSHASTVQNLNHNAPGKTFNRHSIEANLRDEEENEVEIPTLDSPCASNGVQIGEQVLKTMFSPVMDSHPKHRDSHASTVQNLNHNAPGKTFKIHSIEPNLRDEEENEVEIPTFDAPCASNGVEIGEQVLKTKSPAIDVHLICRDSHSSTVQNFNCGALPLERYSIKSNLLPTLEKIWEKHGNVTEGCTLCNTDMISSALESLATTVLILKNNTGRSLTESKADYLRSSLSDLQQMRFKVGWLAPFVEMALAIKKSRSLVDSLKDFSEAKARAQESKMKVLDELAKLDEVEEDLTLLMEKIPVLEEVDLEKGLGEGLY